MRASKLAASALLAAVTATSTAYAEGGGGQDQAKRGSQLYEKYCSLCHGADGRGGSVFPKPIWGPGHGLGKFGNGKALLDYLYLLMPFDDPSKATDEEKLAIATYMLVRNGSLKEGASLTASNAPAVAIR